MEKAVKWFLFILVSSVVYFFLIGGLLHVPICGGFSNMFWVYKILLSLSIILFFVCSLKFSEDFSRKSKIIIWILITIFISFLLISTSLNSARVKSCDSLIKGAISEARSLADIYYKNHKSYIGICFSADGVYPALDKAAKKLLYKNIPTTSAFVYSRDGAPNSAVCHESDTGWAAMVSLRNPMDTKGNIIKEGGGWCVDSTGASKESSSLDVDITKCP